MRKNIQAFKWLALLVGILLMALFGQANLTAKAATVDGSSFVTSAKVINGPDFKPVDTINVQYHLEFGNTPLHSGDVISIPLPNNLSSAKNDTFPVTGPDKTTVIGTGKVSKDGQTIEVTLNDKVEGLTDKELTLQIATKYNGTTYGEQDVHFPNHHDDVINIVTDEANLSKKGVIQDDNTVKWTILVNRRSLEFENLKIEDTIGDNQTMIKGVTVSPAYWTNSTNTSYKREKEPLKAGDDYTVKYTDDGFTLKFNDTVDQMYAIDYYTKIDDPSVVNDGYIFRNQATMTWGGKTGTGTNSEVANGKVSTSSKNTGSGNGSNGIDVNPDTDGDGEIDENGDINTDGDPDTGVIDIDEGTDTATVKPKQPTKKIVHPKTTSKPRQKTKPVVATKTAVQGKLPQTNEANSNVAWIGLALLSGLSVVGGWRHFN